MGDNIKSGARVIGNVLSIHKASGGGTVGMAMIRLDRWAEATQNPTVNETDVQIMGGPDGKS